MRAAEPCVLFHLLVLLSAATTQEDSELRLSRCTPCSLTPSATGTTNVLLYIFQPCQPTRGHGHQQPAGWCEPKACNTRTGTGWKQTSLCEARLQPSVVSRSTPPKHHPWLTLTVGHGRVSAAGCPSRVLRAM